MFTNLYVVQSNLGTWNMKNVCISLFTVAWRGEEEIARMTIMTLFGQRHTQKFFGRFVDVYTAGVHEIRGSHEARGFQQDSATISRVIFAI